MKSVVFVVLVSVAVFAAGAEDTQFKVLKSSLKSTRSSDADFAIIETFFNNCPNALTLYSNCLYANNYNPNPGNNAELCAMARIELNCMDSSIRATPTCNGQQGALDSVARLRPVIEQVCAALGGAAIPVVTGFFTLVLVACVTLLH